MMCHIIVSRMKKVSIRDLKHQTSRVLSRVAEGETVAVYRRSEEVAVLSPPRSYDRGALPDYASRLREAYADLVLPTTGSDLIDADRGDR